MAVEKFAVIVYHCAACGAAAQIGVPSRHGVHSLVNMGQEYVHCAVDVISAAECAYNAVFGKGIALPHGKFGVVFFAHSLRPFGDIVPVLIRCQHPVHGQHPFVLIGINILAVCAAAGPVHKPRYLKRGRVGKLHADIFSHAAGYGFVFVCGRRAIKRDQNAQARGSGGVLAGAVYAVTASQPLHAPQNVLRAAWGYGVKVKRYNVPAGHCARLAACSCKGAGHIPAYVFAVVLFGLAQREVFLHGFRTPRRYAELFVQFGQQQGLRLPVYAAPVVAHRYDYFSVVNHHSGTPHLLEPLCPSSPSRALPRGQTALCAASPPAVPRCGRVLRPACGCVRGSVT